MRAGHPDYDRLIVAAWAHDIARAMSEGDLLARAEEYGLEVLPEDREAPILLHGPVGAEILRRELGWNDEDVLNAVAYHTTGRPEMSELEALLLIADKIELAKVRDEQMKRVRALAADDLWSAVREFYRWHEEKNAFLVRSTHPRATATSRWLAEHYA